VERQNFSSQDGQGSSRRSSKSHKPYNYKRIKPHVCADLEELCAKCGIEVPNVLAPRVTWISISDKISKINKETSEHPWVFFEQDRFDAASTTFSRTTSPNENALPPRRIGTPSHVGEHREGRCSLITLDAWVDFKKCKPLPVFALSLRGKTTRQQIELFASEPGVRVCRNESENIETQLWVALLAHRSIL
jgi:hypothetical protein